MASPKRVTPAQLQQLWVRLRPFLAWAWAHREQFQKVMSHPGWARCFQVVSVLSFSMAAFVYYQQQDFIACIAGYNDAQAASSGARSQAIEDSLAAVDASIHAVATATTRAQIAKALADYEAAREVAKRQRAQNPPPAPPSVRCD